MGAKKALIFGSCPCEDWRFLRAYRTWPDVVIAADGGMLLARQAGFIPQVFIGDGDSGGIPDPGMVSVPLPVEKDVTDLEAAYQWARDWGVTELLITGCTGGRLDHHMAAMSLLEAAGKEGVHARLMDSRNTVEFLTSGSYTLVQEDRKYFSLIPADPVICGLTIKNAKYEIENRDVFRGSSLTVSNEFLDGPVTVSMEDGGCWLIYAE